MMSSGLLIVCPSCAKRKTESLSLLRAKRSYRLELYCRCNWRTLQFCFWDQFRKICVLHQIQCALISNMRPWKRKRIFPSWFYGAFGEFLNLVNAVVPISFVEYVEKNLRHLFNVLCIGSKRSCIFVHQYLVSI